MKMLQIQKRGTIIESPPFSFSYSLLMNHDFVLSEFEGSKDPSLDYTFSSTVLPVSIQIIKRT